MPSPGFHPQQAETTPLIATQMRLQARINFTTRGRLGSLLKA
jgi:hypothetical protein